MPAVDVIGDQGQDDALRPGRFLMAAEPQIAGRARPVDPAPSLVEGQRQVEDPLLELRCPFEVIGEAECHLGIKEGIGHTSIPMTVTSTRGLLTGGC